MTDGKGIRASLGKNKAWGVRECQRWGEGLGCTVAQRWGRGGAGDRVEFKARL